MHPTKDSLRSSLWFPRQQDNSAVVMIMLVIIPTLVLLLGHICGFPSPSLRPVFSVCGTPDMEEVGRKIELDTPSSGY